MRKLAPIMLIVIVLSITLFGYISMAQADHEGSCIGSTMQQATCPTDKSLASINFHIDSLKTFSNAISEVASLPGFLAIALGLTLFLIAKFVWEVTRGSITLSAPQRVRQRIRQVKATSQTLHWILRLNNSPSSVY